MGAPEAELGQDVIGVADEVAVGEEQELDDVPNGVGVACRGVARRRGGRTVDGWKIYVSHIDIFPAGRYRKGASRRRDFRNERLVSAGPGTGTVIALAAQARSHGAAET